MQLSCHKAIGFDHIWEMLVPSSELGRQLKRKQDQNPLADEADLISSYKRIKKLMDAIKGQPKLANILSVNLCHILPIRVSLLHTDDIFETHEIFELKQFLYYYHILRGFYQSNKLTSKYKLPDLSSLFTYLDPDGHKMPVFRLSPNYSKTLGSIYDQLSKVSLDFKHLESVRLLEARDYLQIPNPKPEIVVSRMQGDLIQRIADSGYYHLATENIANVCFKLSSTIEMQNLKQKINHLKERLKVEETMVLKQIKRRIAKDADKIKTAYMAVTHIDWDLCRAIFGVENNCTIPKVNDIGRINLKGAVNLPLYRYLSDSKRHLQPLDIAIEAKVSVLTGPNMGGKTTALRTIGQFCLMLKHAIPIPCQKADLPIFDFIWYNHDNQLDSENLSSFGRETVSFMKMLKQPGKGLILLDEFAKGTNPTEGEALICATIRYLQKKEHTTISATHFSSPARIPNVEQFAIKGFSDDIIRRLGSQNNSDLGHRLKLLNEAMDYRIIRLKTNQDPPLCAMKIAEILGMDEEILQLTIDQNQPTRSLK